MVANLLRTLPSPENLDKVPGNFFVESNAHIHTPYSFSAFENIETLFRIASDEKVKVLGINDFYVADGYGEFHDLCFKYNIFPLFNIEFIGLMKEEQAGGIRINDPNNPGRIYFCGKGLDYPFHLSAQFAGELADVRQESQNQIRAMVSKLNSMTARNYPFLNLDYDSVKAGFAKELVRERHIAKALRVKIQDHHAGDEEKLEILKFLYGGRNSKTDLGNCAALENEIRSNILKAGGTAFVGEDENSFMSIGTIKDIILDAGGIPCYPVLLDDAAGRFTQFEADAEKLCESLNRLGVGCIELIPGRNDHDILERFVRYFDGKGYVILFGTEHNTPEMLPLTVAARGNTMLSPYLKMTGFRGVCLLAAHQYLRAFGKEGFMNMYGSPKKDEKAMFEHFGQAILGNFLKI